MTLHIIGRLAGVLALTVGLAGCIDVSMDIKVKSPTEAQATMTQTIGAQFYPMLKASAKDKDSGDDSFCAGNDKGTLTENADGSATCVIVKEGKFADLGMDENDEKLMFTSPGPGLVRVAFPTKDLSSGITDAAKGEDAASAGQDADSKAAEEQMKQMMVAYFAGHFLTLKVSGGEITDSNMTIAPDKQSAEDKIAFDELINGTAKLPEELYAVVKVQ
jgi:hypothetical protein